MNKCKHLKQKLNKTLYCKNLNKEIKLKQCTNCKFKEYPKQLPISIKSRKKIEKNDGIKKKSAKLSKLERNRFSLFTDNKNTCMFCENTANLTWHEIFGGKNRSNSMKYGLCLRMCLCCHERWQEDKSFNDYWHKLGQQRFMQYYVKTKDEFREIFKKNYL